MTIQWSAQYETGIDVIDNQHKRIVEYINEVHELQKEPNNREAINEVLTLLIDYTLNHFAFEEALMEEAGYEDLEGHKITHQSFVKQIETLHQQYQEGADIVHVLADMLITWLIKHICQDDQSYVPVVRDKILGEKPQHFDRWVSEKTKRLFTNH